MVVISAGMAENSQNGVRCFTVCIVLSNNAVYDDASSCFRSFKLGFVS